MPAYMIVNVNVTANGEGERPQWVVRARDLENRTLVRVKVR